MKHLIGMLVFIHCSLASATNWQCRNHDMEVTCHAKKCEAAESFTPMDVHFNDKGKLSICAYTGCWEGMGKVMTAQHYTMITAQNLKFSTVNQNDMKADFLIVLDTDDQIAMIKGSGYATPMTCDMLNKKHK